MASNYASNLHKSMTLCVVNRRLRCEYSPAMKLRAVLFDAYGTLFDVYSVALLAEQLFPRPGRTAGGCGATSRSTTPAWCTMSGRYRPFWDLTRAGLRFAALRLNLVLDAGCRRAADEPVPPPQCLP
jgi:FMN phosphatase YigB (HAD superfamily)